MTQLCSQKNTSVCGNLNIFPFPHYMSGANSHQNSLLNSGNPLLLKHKNSAKLSKSPALSFAESFSSALTSQPDDMSCPLPSSLLPPQPLRKSISVDSFALYRYSLRGLNATPHHLSENPLHSHSFVPEARLGKHLHFFRGHEFETSSTFFKPPFRLRWRPL